MAKKLNQILAIEKGIKTAAYGAVTELHKATQKSDLFEGFERTYQPTADDGKKLPPESKRVQISSRDAFRDLSAQLTALFDVTATKDYANCQAKADVSVDGKVLLTGVPATYLLFLDKQLTDLHTFVSKFSELDPAADWQEDASTGFYKSKPVETHRSEKVQEAIVLYPATPEHPAQTQLITKDVLVGHWTSVRFSGALPKTRKAQLLDRVQKLHKAVKEALEQANMTEAPQQFVGETIFSYLLG